MGQRNQTLKFSSIAPLVKSQLLPKSEIRNINRLWHLWDREKIETFTLCNLWNCYDEWSAYGAGVPIGLNDNETLVQYYVPYLSAIQIFTSNSSSVNGLREETESGDCERDALSDSYSDESELWRWDGCSSEDGGSEQDSFWHVNNRLSYLYFQYFERTTPYGRVPLMDKVPNLSYSNGKDYKGLVHMLPYLPHSIFFPSGGSTRVAGRARLPLSRKLHEWKVTDH